MKGANRNYQSEFRPKYGPVNFDIIDAVNARLAAASRSSTDNLDANNANNTGKTKKNGDVEVWLLKFLFINISITDFWNF